MDKLEEKMALRVAFGRRLRSEWPITVKDLYLGLGFLYLYVEPWLGTEREGAGTYLKTGNCMLLGPNSQFLNISLLRLLL